MKAHLLVQVSMMFLFSTRFVWFKERGCKHSGSADVCGKMTISSDLCEQFPDQFWAQSLISGHIEENMKSVPWSLVILAFTKDDYKDQWGTSRWWCPPLTGLLAATISFSYILMLNQTSAHLTRSGCLQEAIWLVNGSARVFEWK